MTGDEGEKKKYKNGNI